MGSRGLPSADLQIPKLEHSVVAPGDDRREPMTDAKWLVCTKKYVHGVGGHAASSIAEPTSMPRCLSWSVLIESKGSLVLKRASRASSFSCRVEYLCVVVIDRPAASKVPMTVPRIWQACRCLHAPLGRHSRHKRPSPQGVSAVEVRLGIQPHIRRCPHERER
jgi:hypothetical protein